MELPLRQSFKTGIKPLIEKRASFCRCWLVNKIAIGIVIVHLLRGSA